MTRNQIEYLKLLESQRANREGERLTEARDQTTRELGFAQLGETTRHNMASEGLQLMSIQETTRANKAREEQQRNELAELHRHQVAVETETRRSNMAREAETHSYNQSVINLRSKELSEQQRLHDQQYQLGMSQLAETRRSNAAREAEQVRSNLAREFETYRSNTQQEGLTASRISQTSTLHTIDTQAKYVALGIQGYDAGSRRMSAEASVTQALASQIRANNDSQRLRLEQELQPHKIANLKSNTTRNYTGAVRDVASSLRDVTYSITKIGDVINEQKSKQTRQGQEFSFPFPNEYQY